MPLSKEDKEDIEIARSLRGMIATDGWKHFVRILNAHIETAKSEVLRPLLSEMNSQSPTKRVFSAVDKMLSSEGQKGAILALTMARDLPLGMIGAMDDLIAREKHTTDIAEETD